jgi:hypothetical protein
VTNKQIAIVSFERVDAFIYSRHFYCYVRIMVDIKLQAQYPGKNKKLESTSAVEIK